jgi:phosphomannomutase
MVRQGDVPIYLNGNQSAVLAVDFVLSKMRDAGTLTAKHYIAKTIVTTDMLDALSDAYGITIYGDMLIGFKYIGELILNKEHTDETFVIGGEESYGLLLGTYARDKDGASGALPLAEYAAELKIQGKTLYDRLLDLFVEHDVYVERLDTMVCPGASGFLHMQHIMAALREQPLKKIGEYDVSAVLDYKTLKRRDNVTNEESIINCKSGDVIVLEFGDRRRRITIRPSGTEPKLKFYVQWCDQAAGRDAVEGQYQDLTLKLEGLSKELEGILLER